MKLAATKRCKNTFNRVFSRPELEVAWQLERQRLKASCFGIDRVSGKQFDAERSWRIPSIRERRFSPSFVPSPLLAIAKPKDSGGYRVICVPTIEDRVIQFSLLATIRDTLNSKKLLNSVSYGLVANSGRTVQDARDRATVLREQGRWVYKADIQKFFDRIPRCHVEAAVRRIVPHRSLHGILSSFTHVEIGGGFSANWQTIVDAAGIIKGVGVRQGMPLSPYFAGILLRDLDLLVEKKRLPVIRYVDDIIGFFKSRKECEDFDTFLRDKLGALGLQLGLLNDTKSKTMIFEPDQPAEFVGMQLTFKENGKCILKVSEKTLQRIEARFAGLMDFQVLMQEGITLPILGARLEAMSRGYISAYHGADNMADVKDRVASAARPIIQTVLEGIFGASMRVLDSKERKFLGLQ